MGQSWDRKAAGAVSDAIPNEVSKLNGYAKYLQYIPYVGAFLKGISNGVSGVDRFGETYSNGGSLTDSLQWGMGAMNDTSADPNKYSPKNDSWDNADGWLKAGKIGEALPGSKTDVGSVGRTGNLVGGILSDSNTHQSEHGPGSPGYNSNSFDFSSILGTGSKSSSNQYEPAIRTYPTTSPAGYNISFGNGSGGGDVNRIISQTMNGLKTYSSRAA